LLALVLLALLLPTSAAFTLAFDNGVICIDEEEVDEEECPLMPALPLELGCVLWALSARLLANRGTDDTLEPIDCGPDIWAMGRFDTDDTARHGGAMVGMPYGGREVLPTDAIPDGFVRKLSGDGLDVAPCIPPATLGTEARKAALSAGLAADDNIDDRLYALAEALPALDVAYEARLVDALYGANIGVPA